MPTRNTIPAQAVALNAEGDAAPEWVQLLPAGPSIMARDGRRWRMSNPQGVVAAFASNNADLPIDYEHADRKSVV